MIDTIDKQITRDILLKLLETKAFHFELVNGNMTPAQVAETEQRNVQTVCKAYETLLRTVANSNA